MFIDEEEFGAGSLQDGEKLFRAADRRRSTPIIYVLQSAFIRVHRRLVA
jgi:hypothetical protein